MKAFAHRLQRGCHNIIACKSMRINNQIASSFHILEYFSGDWE